MTTISLPDFSVKALISGIVLREYALSGLMSTATRDTLGASSANNSKRFADRTSPNTTVPVTLPPGRAKLAANPLPTGSPTVKATMGILFVALEAADTAGVLWVT